MLEFHAYLDWKQRGQPTDSSAGIRGAGRIVRPLHEANYAEQPRPQMLEAAHGLVRSANDIVDSISGRAVGGTFTIGSVRSSALSQLPRAPWRIDRALECRERSLSRSGGRAIRRPADLSPDRPDRAAHDTPCSGDRKASSTSCQLQWGVWASAVNAPARRTQAP